MSLLGAAAISGGIGLLGGIFGTSQAKKQQEKQHEYNKELMALQQGYNQQNAAIAQQYNKDLWDYTNYENQVKHLKEAGLNPALLYGKGGGGGASASGASPMGVSAVGGNEIAAGAPYMQAYTQMGLSLADIASNIELKQSQANKNNTEADKIAGVDTELSRAQQKLTEMKEKTEQSMQALNSWNMKEKEAAIDKIRAEIEKTQAEVDLLMTNTEITKESKNVILEQRKADLENTYKQGLKMLAETSKTRQEEKFCKAMEEQGWAKIKQYMREVETGKMNAETAAMQVNAYVNDVANKYDINERSLMQGWVQTFTGLFKRK